MQLPDHFPLPDAPELIADPLARFHAWFAEAKEREDILEPTAMSLATATLEGLPSLRIVLLKEAAEDGFVWYTNAESRKGTELNANPHAALCFHWMPLRRQIRVEGPVVPVSEAESDAYFAGRARDSQIGAWASLQSRPLDTRETFEARIAEFEEKFAGKDVPRPAVWHGWRLVPRRLEFWSERPYRLHERDIYTATYAGWALSHLYP